MSLLLTPIWAAEGLPGKLKVRGSEESGMLEFIVIHRLVDQFGNDNDSQLKVKRLCKLGIKNRIFLRH